MIIGRICGQITMTINHDSYDGRVLLIVDRLNPAGEPSGGYLIAVDSIGAGTGQTVLVVDEGTGAQQILGCPGAPIRSVIVGIIDAVDRPVLPRRSSM